MISAPVSAIILIIEISGSDKLSEPLIKLMDMIVYDYWTGQRNHLIHINQWFRQLESEPLIKLTCMIYYD